MTDHTRNSRQSLVLAIAPNQVLKAMGLAHAEMAKEMAPAGLTDEREIRGH
jgi:hypothetical protein